ncbi:FMN-linked oxidoreductase [Pluteus cervinus]|uniref:FMN-linked oxidoreductase n=1 Tax=Pluteus cervinus TaxID=181527 RepID=A0ACD3AXA2_9AGAR|nr:FMN-linked oxidoreductase [Pluteus cervinus]
MSEDAFSSVSLPCGRVLRNRLVKVSLYEHLANLGGGPPNEYLHSLYSVWAMYDWGMIMTGNVQVSSSHLSLGRDIVIPSLWSEVTLAPFRQLSEAMHSSRRTEESPLAIMQLNHAGRQSSNFLGGRYPFQPALAPSAVPMRAKGKGLLVDFIYWLLFQTPRAMTIHDIDELVSQFVKGSLLAVETGFDGIELHVAHGYLLAQFISSRSNKRTDQYSSSEENALRLLQRVFQAIREAVPANFVVGIKINSADYAQTGDEERAMKHFLTIAQWQGVDFIEISGGDYESPDFLLQDPVKSRSSRQATFSRFASQATKALHSLPNARERVLPRVLLTGGLKTPGIIQEVLANGDAELLGIARPAITAPDLPHLLHNTLQQDPQESSAWDELFRPGPVIQLPLFLSRLTSLLPAIPLVGASVEMSWYTMAMRNLARKHMRGEFYPLSGSSPIPDYGLGTLTALWEMWFWLSPDERVGLRSYWRVAGGIALLFGVLLSQVFLA